MSKNFYLACIVLFLFFSCSNKTAKTYASKEDILSGIRNFSAKDVNSSSKMDLINSLGQFGYGSAYYFSYYAEHFKIQNMVQRLLYSEMTKNNPFLERAIVRYVNLLSRAELDASALINIRIRNLGKSLTSEDVVVYANAILDFYEGKYQDANKKLEKVDINKLKMYNLDESYNFVSLLLASRLNRQSTTALLDEAFLSPDFTKLKKKGYLWLNKTSGKDKLKHLSLYQAYALASDSKYGEAYRIARPFLLADDLSFLNKYPKAITDLTYLANRAGKRAEMIGILETAMPNFNDLTKAYASLNLASMYRNRELLGQSLDYTKLALNYDLEDKDRDKALWFLLDLNHKLNNNSDDDKANVFYQTMIDSMPKWTDKAYYDDILEELLVDLIAGRQFSDIYYIYNEAIRKHASLSEMSHYAYVLLEAFDAGFDLGYTNTLVNGRVISKRELRDELINTSLKDVDSYPYYMVLAKQKKTPNFLKSIDKKQEANVFNIDYFSQDESAFLPNDIILKQDKGFDLREVYYKALSLRNDKPVSSDAYTLGFFYYGLYKQNWFFNSFFTNLLKNQDKYSVDALRLIARELNSSSMFLKTINLMRKVVNRTDYIPNIADMKIMYPKPYAKDIEGEAKKRDINPYVYYALIRQESGFTKDIVSSAKAVGLAQIMPASGKEFSRILNMPNYDLTNPSDNITFGAHYLNWMKKNIDGMYAILMGYNAGPTRIRRWINTEWTDLPPALKVESAKYEETRNYVKNITVSASNYAYIYDDVPIYKTVRTIFPNY